MPGLSGLELLAYTSNETKTLPYGTLLLLAYRPCPYFFFLLDLPLRQKLLLLNAGHFSSLIFSPFLRHLLLLLPRLQTHSDRRPISAPPLLSTLTDSSRGRSIDIDITEREPYKSDLKRELHNRQQGRNHHHSRSETTTT